MIALDTNILIYSCDKADLKRQQVALDLVSSAGDGVLLWQVACEFVAASRPPAWNAVLRASTPRTCRAALFAGRLKS
jgi:predicted nucleic acid-binding protein